MEERDGQRTAVSPAAHYAALLALPGGRVESWSYGAAAVAFGSSSRARRIDCEVDAAWVRLSARVLRPVEVDVARLEAWLRRNDPPGRVRLTMRQSDLMVRAEYPVSHFDADDFRQLGRELAQWLNELNTELEDT